MTEALCEYSFCKTHCNVDFCIHDHKSYGLKSHWSHSLSQCIFTCVFCICTWRCYRLHKKCRCAVYISKVTILCSCFRPAVLISLVFFWIQLLLAKYVFLVDKDTTLALDNRYAKVWIECKGNTLSPRIIAVPQLRASSNHCPALVWWVKIFEIIASFDHSPPFDNQPTLSSYMYLSFLSLPPCQVKNLQPK